MPIVIPPPHFTLMGTCSDAYMQRIYEFAGRLNSKEYRGHPAGSLCICGCKFGGNLPHESMLFRLKFRRWPDDFTGADDDLPPVDFNLLPDGDWIEEPPT